MDITCVVTEDIDEVAFQHCEIREPEAGELLIETAYSGISPGTELRCIAGKEPFASSFPMITGYSLVGKALKGAGDFKEGDLVFLNGTSIVPDGISSSWGGHLSHAIAVPAQAAKLPPDIDLRQASLLSMCAIAIHGVCKSRLIPGDRALVVGQGLIGQLAAALCRINGCITAVCDPMPYRLDISRQMGIEHVYQVDDDWPATLRRDFTDGFDALIDATGSPNAIDTNQELLRVKSWENPYDPSPRIALLASYPGDIRLNYQETLFAKEAEIVTCRTYLPHERERVLRLLAGGAINVDPLITDTVPAREASDAFARLRKEPGKYITVVLDWTVT